MVQTLLKTNTEGETQESARDDLAFFVPKRQLIRQNLFGLQREIAGTTEVVRSIGQPALREVLRAGLDEAINSMEQTIKAVSGVLWIAFKNTPNLVRYSRAEALIADYENIK